MDEIKIEGVKLSPLKIIGSEKGSVLHAMKQGDDGFEGFGEAYFSTVNKGAIKGWKRHTRMTLNLVVPFGSIRFVIYDGRDNSATRGSYFDVTLSRENYKRLTVSPGLWMAFQGVGDAENILLNLASIKHDPQEAENCDLETAEMKFPTPGE